MKDKRQLFSHFFHGHGRSGSVALYLRPGKSDFQTLFKSTFVRDNTKPGGEPRCEVAVLPLRVARPLLEAAMGPAPLVGGKFPNGWSPKMT
jgi:hypothetical protein